MIYYYYFFTKMKEKQTFITQNVINNNITISNYHEFARKKWWMKVFAICSCARCT